MNEATNNVLDKHPLFCFQYLTNIAEGDKEKKAAFIKKLVTLSQLTWKDINQASRHSNGFEKICLKEIKTAIKNPLITEDVKKIRRFSFLWTSSNDRSY